LTGLRKSSKERHSSAYTAGFWSNLSRIREIEQGFKGTLFVTTDTRTHETVPVARRHVPQLHRALGL